MEVRYSNCSQKNDRLAVLRDGQPLEPDIRMGYVWRLPLKTPVADQYGLVPPGAFPVEIGAAGIVGRGDGLGAIGGAGGIEGIGASPVVPEGLGASDFGVSFAFGISLGVDVGAGAGVTGTAGVAQGSQPQDGFLKDQLLILSSRFGRSQVWQGAGAGAQPQDDFGVRWALILSNKLGLEQPQEGAGAGAQPEQPPA
jgi:hypothetical protein